MASYITERVFGQIPMSARIVVPEDLAPVLKAVTEIPSDDVAVENDIVQLIKEQAGYNVGHYYQYLKDINTGVFSWVDISTNIPTGKQAGSGFYVHVGSRVFLMWIDPPGTISNMRQVTSEELDIGPDPTIQYYIIKDISPDSKPNSVYIYVLAGDEGIIESFDEGINYFIKEQANPWVKSEVYLADVNGIRVEGETELISTDIHNQYCNDGCGVTNPRLNVKDISDNFKFILRVFFKDGSHVDSCFQPFQLSSNVNTLGFQSDWNCNNEKCMDFIRNKPLLLRKLIINNDGDLIAFADDPATLQRLYIDADGYLILDYSDDEDEDSDQAILDRCVALLDEVENNRLDISKLAAIIAEINGIVTTINNGDSGITIRALADTSSANVIVDKISEIITFSVKRGAFTHG